MKLGMIGLHGVMVAYALFVGIATDVLVNDDQGGVRHLCRGGAAR